MFLEKCFRKRNEEIGYVFKIEPFSISIFLVMELIEFVGGVKIIM